MKLKQISDVTRSPRIKPPRFFNRDRVMNWSLFFGLEICLFGIAPTQVQTEVQAMLNPGFTVAQFSADSQQISQGFDDLITEVKAIEVSSLPSRERQNITVNQEQTYQAFTICEPRAEVEGCQETIFIEAIATEKYYQISGIPLSWRPFSNLIWQDETILQFDRWSNPHYGWRYTVDLTHKKLVDLAELEKSPKF